MKKMALHVVSMVCALCLLIAGSCLAYHAEQPAEPAMAPLEQVEQQTLYQLSQIEDPSSLQYVETSTEELLSSSENPLYSSSQSDPMENQPSASSQTTAESSAAAIPGPDDMYGMEEFNPSSSSEPESLEPESSSSEETGSSELSGSDSAGSSSSESGGEQPGSSESTSQPSSSESSQSSSDSSGGGSDPQPTGTTLRVQFKGVDQIMKASEVLPYFVAGEMMPYWGVEELKAQAVASHTYVQHLNNKYPNKAVVVPLGGESAINQKIIDLCREVGDQLIYYNGQVIEAQYCTATAGATRNSGDVYVGTLPYLVSVESKYDSLGAHWDSKVYISHSQFKQMMQESRYTQVTLTGDPSSWIQILSHTPDGYVDKVRIGNKEIRGWDLYYATNYKTKSAWFTVESVGDEFVFTTRGYGHAVGMSQWGAHLYASEEGWNYKQILTHYYANTVVG